MNNQNLDELNIPCPKCRRETKILKAEFWGKIFRCVFCTAEIADQTAVDKPPTAPPS
jgi:transcription elongation factor Elf1